MRRDDLNNFLKELARESGRLTMKYFRKSLKANLKEGDKGIVSEADIATENFIKSQILAKYPSHKILAEEGSPEVLKTYNDCVLWMIDPIDGTTNFVQGNPYYNVSIAVYQIKNGEPEALAAAVHHPPDDDLYFAGRGEGAYCNSDKIAVRERMLPAEGCFATGFGYNKPEVLKKIMASVLAVRSISPQTTVRVNGAAALDMCHTASGVLDAFWEYNLSPWDMAAGALIVQEAGGVVTNFEGKSFNPLKDRNVLCGASSTHRLLIETIRPFFT